jgi:hypothetical protein
MHARSAAASGALLPFHADVALLARLRSVKPDAAVTALKPGNQEPAAQHGR